ncbi:unnamed protein product [Arctogadus glacialis]
MTFPLDTCPIRTDKSFAQKHNEEHHQGPDPFQGLNVGMVSQFPGDYMHSVCLGVAAFFEESSPMTPIHYLLKYFGMVTTVQKEGKCVEHVLSDSQLIKTLTRES